VGLTSFDGLRSGRTDVSIVVVASNVREEVLACWDSVHRHAGDLTVEGILVDNGSVDGTPEAVAQRFPEVKVVRRPTNEGVAARSYGLAAATGRMRMFLDSDARLTNGALTLLVHFLDEKPSVGLVGPKLVYPDGSLQLSTRRYPPLLLPLLRRPPLAAILGDSRPVRWHLMADERHDLTREVEYVLGACQLFTAEAQAAAGDIDREIFYGPDDADWCFRVRMAGFKVAYLPAAEVVHEYRRSTASRPVSRLAWKHLRAFVRFHRRWWPHRRRLIEEGREMDSRLGERWETLHDESEAVSGGRQPTFPIDREAL
jgi:GT2 family glycosyltransferase